MMAGEEGVVGVEDFHIVVAVFLRLEATGTGHQGQ
jgi:hypothetical protein